MGGMLLGIKCSPWHTKKTKAASCFSFFHLSSSQFTNKLKCYPQQHDSFSIFFNATHRFLPEPLDAAPEPARTQFGWRAKPAKTWCGHCARTLRKLLRNHAWKQSWSRLKTTHKTKFCCWRILCLCNKKHRNPLELHKASAPEPPRTSQGICTGNLTSCLHRSPPEPHQVSAPKPSGTLQTEPSGTFEGVCPEPSGTSPLIFTWTPRNPGICTRNFRNLTRYPHQNPPESHKVSAPETSGTYLQPSGTARVICTGTLRNLTRYLHRKSPEPCPEPGVEAAPDRTGANLS